VKRICIDVENDCTIKNIYVSDGRTIYKVELYNVKSMNIDDFVRSVVIESLILDSKKDTLFD